MITPANTQAFSLESAVSANQQCADNYQAAFENGPVAKTIAGKAELTEQNTSDILFNEFEKLKYNQAKLISRRYFANLSKIAYSSLDQEENKQLALCAAEKKTRLNEADLAGQALNCFINGTLPSYDPQTAADFRAQYQKLSENIEASLCGIKTPLKKSTLVLAAGAEKYLRLRTLSLDGERAVPFSQEQFLYQSHINDLKRASLPALLLASKADTADLYNIQTSIWEDEQTEGVQLTALNGELPLVDKELLFGGVMGGEIFKIILAFILLAGVIIFVIVKRKRFLKRPIILAFYIITLLILLIIFSLLAFNYFRDRDFALTSFGQIKGKTAYAQELTSTISLDKYVARGDVSVKAISRGGFTELDIWLKNNSNEEIMVDLQGSYFIPVRLSETRVVALYILDEVTPFLESFPRAQDLDPLAAKEYYQNELASAVSELEKSTARENLDAFLGYYEQFASFGEKVDIEIITQAASAYKDQEVNTRLDDYTKDPSEENYGNLLEALNTADLMGLPQEDINPILKSAAQSFVSALQTKLDEFKNSPNTDTFYNILEALDTARDRGVEDRIIEEITTQTETIATENNLTE